ncbi:hypothetical protein [Methylocella sp.]|uniref:hypothetical protein n=1 Tax=Methylocella sp. TaxID=1978226 RepID=UPI0035AF42A0
MKDNIRDLQGSVHALRTEVHALRGDVLRQERSMAALELDVDRIKVRLSLNDTQQ